MWPREEARRFFGSRGEPLKVQLIDEKTEGQAEVSCYTIKDRETFVDFCVGPHVPSTGRLKAFKLLSTSNAYWKGDARNQPMQRIYGTAFFADKDLQAHVHRLEAKKRDHRKIGRDQKLFMFHPWAPGATFWLGKGTIVYNTWLTTCAGAGPGRLRGSEGAHRVQQGALGNLRTLAALPAEHVSRRERRRADGAQGDELPRPLPDVCERVRSYRDLPIRFHEQTPLHRNEASGVLSGLTRPPIQPGRRALLRHGVANRRGSRAAAAVGAACVCRFRADTRDEALYPPPEFLGTVETWNHAEAELKRALEAAGAPYTINEGDGAFYGPKIDFDVTDAIGRKWQCATIQLDYMQAERFDLTYIGADNAEHRPVIIHRAIFGSFERFIALLIEHFAGAWPLWLAPVQAVVLPI